MENKHVGLIIVGIAVVMVVIVLIFNSALKTIVEQGCGLAHGGESCPMYDTIKTQTGISLAIVGIVAIIGFVIMFQRPKERLVVKIIKEKKRKLDLSGLDKDEKKVTDYLMSHGNAVFQADLMEALEMGKVKTTRLLDKLESKQIIERKRRGMNNLVALKNGE